MKQRRFTPEKRAKFLDVLSKTGNVSEAARAANASRRGVYNTRLEDPEFAVAWDDAEKEGADALEKEARRRAVDGVLEPVYQKGQKVGVIRRYSDTLLIFLMKGANPEKYAERRRIEGDPDKPVKHEHLVAGGMDLAALIGIYEAKKPSSEPGSEKKVG